MREAFGQSFDIQPGYLNTTSIGVPPVAAADAVRDAVDRWRTGSARPADFDEWVVQARAAFAALIGVTAADVAVGASVSQVAGLVAASIPNGAKVLVARGEFTSVTFPFAAQGHLRLTEVDLDDLVSLVPEHDVVAVSVAQSADGRVVDLAGLAAAASASGTRVMLDVTQAAGWVPLRLDWADWVVGCGYKWLMSTRGAAWLAVRRDRLEELVAHSANWYAGEDRWASIYGLPLRLAADARGLDLSPVWFSHLGAGVVMPWLAKLDMAEVREHCVGLAAALLTGLDLPAAGSAIVSVGLPGADRALAEAGVVASTRAGRARLAFHLYNTVEDVEMALAALRPLHH
ncbi:MAG: aminotransferase class V-fold PLP-dependent enzyme [Sciscionella sp.]